MIEDLENFDFRIFFLNLLDRNFERFRTWIFLYLIKYPKNFRDNNYSIKNFFTHCWWKIRKISNLDKIFCRRFPWWHAWFNDQNPSLLALYVQGVQDEKLDRLRRNFIARKEETKRGQVINRLSRFPPTNRIKKEGKLLRFGLLLVLKFNSHSRYLRGKVETTQVSFCWGRTRIWAESIVADYYGGCARHLVTEF